MRVAIFTKFVHKTVILHTVCSLGAIHAKILEITEDKLLLLETERYEIPMQEATEDLRRALSANRSREQYNALQDMQRSPTLRKITTLLDPRAVCAIELVPANPQEN